MMSYIEKTLRYYVDNFDTSTVTISGYRYNYRLFFRSIKDVTFNWLDKHYFDEDVKKERDYKDDIKNFFRNHVKHLAPVSRRTYRSVIRGFFKYNGKPFDDIFWGELRRYGVRKGSGTIVEDECPSPQELKKILSHAGVRGKALFLLLSSSGIRIGEALKLRIHDHIDWDRNMIKLPYGIAGKKGPKRITFMSPEARFHIDGWLKERKDYMEDNERYYYYEQLSPEGIKAREDLLFPFSIGSAQAMWHSLLKKSGYDKRDENKIMVNRRKRSGNGNIKVDVTRYIFHIHSLRQFFITQMRLRAKDGTRVPKSVINKLVGHKVTSLDIAYDRTRPDALEREYLRGLDHLLIYEKPVDTGGLQKQLDEIKDDNVDLREKYNRLMEDFYGVLQEDIKKEKGDIKGPNSP